MRADQRILAFKPVSTGHERWCSLPEFKEPGKHCQVHEKQVDLRFAWLGRTGLCIGGQPTVLGKPAESSVHALHLVCTTIQHRRYQIALDRVYPGPGPHALGRVRTRILRTDRLAGSVGPRTLFPAMNNFIAYDTPGQLPHPLAAQTLKHPHDHWRMNE
jgi:hypothetical protein